MHVDQHLVKGDCVVKGFWAKLIMVFLVGVMELNVLVLKFNTYTARPVCWREWIS